ncbi:MAG: alpha/beta hydrolase family protein [Nevskiales bacterium]
MHSSKASRNLLILLATGLLIGCGGGSSDFTALDGGGGSSSAEIKCSRHSDVRLQDISDEGIRLTSALGLAAGRYALPATEDPTQLVVMFHGNHNDSCAWRNHLRQAAARGAVAVAMDYTGQRQEPVENYGWFVKEGAADSIAAAKLFMARYPSIQQVFAFGISMGGNASGVAVASPDAVRSDGSRLFDWWVDVEGVNNLVEQYLVARAIVPVNPSAATAVQEIEEENGGTFEQVPDAYVEITNVARVQDMAGLKGVVLVNGLDDGLVPTIQSPEMTLALNAAGIPAHQYTVLLRGDGESGSTATGLVGDLLFAALGLEYPAPLAGHGWEGSDTHLVIKTGFEQLYVLMEGANVAPGLTVIPGF